MNQKPIRILSSDILIIDAITQLEGNPKLQELVKRYGLKPGGKSPLSKEQFEEFSAAIKDHPVIFTPGGSSANTLTTLSKLMGREAQVDFIGVTGKSMYSEMIRDGLDEAHINLIPNEMPGGIRPESAVSFVIVYPDGQRSIATYPGNAREVLKPDIITDELVDKSDVLFIQGSLWQKLGHAFPDKLMELRWNKDKELWLAMPTHAQFGSEKADLFQWLVPSANLVLGNDEELARIYKTTPEKALQKLHETFRGYDVFTPEGKAKPRQVGFITQGEHGAAVVTAKGITHIDPMPPKEIKNTVGAGDTSFAGFAFGHLKGLPDELSAQMAMALAGEKLKLNSARLPDPKATLQQVMPKVFREIYAPAHAGVIGNGTAH